MGLKYLITGATGFIGANIVRSFLDENNEIHIIVRETSNLWRLNDIVKDIIIHYCDINDSDKVERVISALKPDIIIHNAIYGGYPFQKDSMKIINTNFLGTVNLLNACIGYGFKCFINTGSSSEYGGKNKPMSENDLLEPIDDYGVAKAAATLYCQSIARRYNLPVFTLRLFSPYGYYEEPTRLIPYIITSCLRNEDIKLSNPNPVRDFIFIEDVIEAYKTVIKNAQYLTHGDIFNIGTGKQYTVKEVFETIKEIIGYNKEPLWGTAEGRVSDTFKIWKADVTKSKEKLGWEATHSLKEGLTKNINWFTNNLKLYTR
ncbi:NAD-dependent epimerase/dehydratase family protein [Caldanaerobius fijiensis]|nr:SDR family NAD(P)-dependent oxidoreductase [Caldanaerobius fijiensis]